MSSQVARLKAQIDAKSKFGPEHHNNKARTHAEKEKIQIETAKKMASRFNLTYRALALSAAKKAAENRQKDLEAAKQAKEAAARYQMTARALQMSSTGTAQGKVNVLNTPASPTATAPPAKQSSASTTSSSSKSGMTIEELAASQKKIDEEQKMLRAAAPTNADGREEDDMIGDLVLVKREDDEGSVLIDDAKFDMMSRITEVTREQDHEEHDAFWMPTLATALQDGDEHDINVAVVKSFFEEHDPSRIEEANELVTAHSGREELLMDALNAQYPASSDVEKLYEDTEEAKLQQAARPSSSRKSARVTGLTLSVRLNDGSAPLLEASLKKEGESGFILSGVKPDRRSHKFTVNSENGEQQRLLRERMAKKGVATDVIEAVVGESSEML